MDTPDHSLPTLQRLSGIAILWPVGTAPHTRLYSLLDIASDGTRATIRVTNPADPDDWSELVHDDGTVVAAIRMLTTMIRDHGGHQNDAGERS